MQLDGGGDGMSVHTGIEPMDVGREFIRTFFLFFGLRVVGDSNDVPSSSLLPLTRAVKFTKSSSPILSGSKRAITCMAHSHESYKNVLVQYSRKTTWILRHTERTYLLKQRIFEFYAAR